MWRRLQRTRRDRADTGALAGAPAAFTLTAAAFAFTTASFAVTPACAAACATTTTATPTAPKCGIVANPFHGIRRGRGV